MDLINSIGSRHLITFKPAQLYQKISDRFIDVIAALRRLMTVKFHQIEAVQIFSHKPFRHVPNRIGVCPLQDKSNFTH